MATQYNERAWAADVITEINHIIRGARGFIQRAGGEYTVTGNTTPLFPDVLLFRDPTAAVILQGWELKMPDTPIDNHDLLDNAEEKARRLGLDSFLVWNVAHAKLYRLNPNAPPTLLQHWDDLQDIRRRQDVQPSETRWKQLLPNIISSLQDRFVTGDLNGRPFVEAYESAGPVSLINRNLGSVSHTIQTHQQHDTQARDRIALWWRAAQREFHNDETPEDILSRIILVDWVSKFLFAHLLLPRFAAAHTVTSIDTTTPITDAIELFDDLTRSCDFWTVFAPRLGQEMLSQGAWSDLLQFHQLLGDLRIGSVSQQQLACLLERTVTLSRRALRGQFTTPPALAQLLARLALHDMTAPLADFCCGTGTIPRAAVDIKQEYNVPVSRAVQQVWASDWSDAPLQLASIALANPDHVGTVLQVFKHDVFALQQGQRISFRDPNTGAPVFRCLPEFHAIASNLPFVGQNGRGLYRTQMGDINTWIRSTLNTDQALLTRSDVAAYIPFALWQLLAPNGWLAIIITNAWLGTHWGSRFRTLLLTQTDRFQLIRW